MTYSSLLSFIEDIGLSENEAKVYLASLSLGPSSILKIAKTAEIKRTTAYSVIESLKRKGLIATHLQGFKQVFAAENPERIESLLETRRLNLKNHLPQLLSLYNLKGNESYIKFYEGIEGTKNAYDGLLRDVKPSDDYLVIADASEWYNLEPDYFQDFLERRAKFVHTRLLLQYSTKAAELKKYEKNYNLTIKFLPEKTTLTTNLVIIPQRLVIHHLRPPIMAIVIENESIIATNQQMFEIIWQALPNSDQT